jgi:hypothetical protein
MTRYLSDNPEKLSCARCKETKVVSEFPVVKIKGVPTYFSYCIDCRNLLGRENYRKHLEKRKTKSRTYYATHKEEIRIRSKKYAARHPLEKKAHALRFNYGITLEQYEAMVAAQEDCCAICGNPPSDKRKLAVDHNHDTGAVRGLLCTTCNVGIGALKDDLRLLRAAVNYLEGFE